MKQWFYASKLNGISYDIRGRTYEEAGRLEREGVKVLRLNIGNTSPFGLNAPFDLIQGLKESTDKSQGYEHSKGILSVRKAIADHYKKKDILLDTENICIGNGVSELIVMSMQALLNVGDEVLVPMPDYPLWTAAVRISGGVARHYICDENNGWCPDIDNIKSLIKKETKAIVIINPNNPTGAVYSKDILLEIIKVCSEHGILIFADEIYDQIIFDNTEYYNMAELIKDYPLLFFGGLSKNYRAPGFRCGWMCIKDPLHQLKNYIKGLEVLSTMRLCSNVPAQYAALAALTSSQESVRDLVSPEGRLYKQKKAIVEELSQIPGISFVEPKGSLYIFPKMDIKKFSIKSDEQFVLDLLKKKHILLTHGRAFNWHSPDHFRIVMLPEEKDIREAMGRLKDFFGNYNQSNEL